MRISIIIPVLNEAPEIIDTLAPLQPWRAAGHEIIAVDGGSSDGTPMVTAPLVDRLLRSERGRARQMNIGAEAASGDVLLFLHADTRLPPHADRLIIAKLIKTGLQWGRFDVRLSGDAFALRIIERLMNARSRISGIATGDQAIFVRREQFRRVGGFPCIGLMEDVALSRRLKRDSPPLCLYERVITSSRRWETRGILITIASMWYFRLAYALGADPEHLARRYYPK